MSVWSASQAGEPLRRSPRPGAAAEQPDSLASAVSWASIAAGAAAAASLSLILPAPEASVEHAGVKDLIAQLQGVEPDGEMYGARVKVLSEYVKHHVKEAQNELFPKAKAASLDIVELGARMAARKHDLMDQAA